MVILISLSVPVHAGDRFNPSLSGERNIGQEYSWTIQNVSGLSDVCYNTSVYDFKIIGSQYTYYSIEWGQWFTEQADTGKKYLIVWARTESNGTSWYGWGGDRFTLWVWGNTTIVPDPVPLQDLPIKYQSEHYLTRVIAELQNRTGTDGELLTREWYGWKDGNELDRQEPGSSAAYDGMILYQIPEEAQPEDIRVLGWFGYYGYGIWYLTEQEELIQVVNTQATQAEEQKPIIQLDRIIRGKKSIGTITRRAGNERNVR